MPQEGWLWERRPGRLYGSTWLRRWCEVNGGRLRVYDANKAREVATIHIRAETTLIDRLTEDEVRRVGRAPQANAAAVYFRLMDRVDGRVSDFAAESEADAARWIAAITPTPVGDLLDLDVPSPPPLPPAAPLPPSAPPPVCSVDGAYTFTGSASSYLTATPRTPTIGGTSGLTISAWVKRSTSGDAWDRVIDFGSGASASNFLVGFAAGMTYTVYHGGSLGEFSVNTAFPVSVWTHVALVASQVGSTSYGPAAIYWDGVLKASTASMRFPQDVTRSGYYVGRSHWWFSPFGDPMFQGEMRDLLIWDFALSVSQLDDVRLANLLPASASPLVEMMRSSCDVSPPFPDHHVPTIMSVLLTMASLNILTIGCLGWYHTHAYLAGITSYMYMPRMVSPHTYAYCGWYHRIHVHTAWLSMHKYIIGIPTDACTPAHMHTHVQVSRPPHGSPSAA